jgi:hypothetical protein
MPRSSVAEVVPSATARHGGPSPRLRLAIAAVIALTSMLGAVAAWRASVASGEAGGADRKGFADTIAREQQQAIITSSLDHTLFQFLRARSYSTQSDKLRRAAGKAAGTDASGLQAQSNAYQAVAENIDTTVSEDALAEDGSLALQRAFQIEWANASSTQDLDPAPEFAAAEASRTRAERLVGLTALMIAAAFFLTLAQISKTRAHLLYFGGGVGVLVVATALLAVEAA